MLNPETKFRTQSAAKLLGPILDAIIAIEADRRVQTADYSTY